MNYTPIPFSAQAAVGSLFFYQKTHVASKEKYGHSMANVPKPTRFKCNMTYNHKEK